MFISNPNPNSFNISKNHNLLPNKKQDICKASTVFQKVDQKRKEEISNPANLSKEEIDGFLEFLMLHLKKCLNEKQPTHDEKNAQKLAESYSRGDISLSELLSKVSILDLKFRKLDTLPKGMSLLSNLRILGLTFNNISDLPDELHHLTQLKSINLSCNENLKSFPRVLYKDKMPNLIKIYVEKTNIKELPISLEEIIYAPIPRSAKWIDK